MGTVKGMLPRKHNRDVRSLTAGLNNPPLILKKTHAFTARENPKQSATYCSC
jgi:hypothetical protein